MKKLRLSELQFETLEFLNREQLKNVLGGSEGETGGVGGTCTVKIQCATTITGQSSEVSCSGTGGRCSKEAPNPFSRGWVKCDNDPKVEC